MWRLEEEACILDLLKCLCLKYILQAKCVCYYGVSGKEQDVYIVECTNMCSVHCGMVSTFPVQKKVVCMHYTALLSLSHYCMQRHRRCIVLTVCSSSPPVRHSNDCDEDSQQSHQHCAHNDHQYDASPTFDKAFICGC